jgi:flagellar basal body-associated protein FliL
MKRNTIIILVVLIVAIGGYLYWQKNKKVTVSGTNNQTKPPVADNPTEPSTGFSTDPTGPSVMV